VTSSAPAAARRAAVGRITVGLLVALSGCATQPPGELPPIGDFDERRDVLSALDAWAFSGRIAVRDGDDGFNGNLHWEQRRDYFDARVSGPLGAGTVLIAGDADKVTITDDDGEVTALADPERTLEARYGWRIPVGSLSWWALGLPDPSRPATSEVDESGRLASLEQGGWSVDIDQYRGAGGASMPRRLTARQGSARVRLVIDRWTFY